MKRLFKAASIAGTGVLLLGGFAFAAVGNSNTGFGSENNASIEEANTAAIVANNDVELTNTVDGTMLTGSNDSSYNTGNGTADSGDAMADITATNHVNDSKVSMMSGGFGLIMPSVENNTTGAESVNNAWVLQDNALDIAVTNSATVSNSTTVLADTGLNTSSYNTGSGHVSSGNASLKVNFSTTANSSDVSTH